MILKLHANAWFFYIFAPTNYFDKREMLHINQLIDTGAFRFSGIRKRTRTHFSLNDWSRLQRELLYIIIKAMF